MKQRNVKHLMLAVLVAAIGCFSWKYWGPWHTAWLCVNFSIGFILGRAS